jgi:PAS domain S-box-containing protein
MWFLAVHLGHAAALTDPSTLLGGTLLLVALHLIERRRQEGGLNTRRQIDIFALLDYVPDAAFIFDNRAQLLDCNRSGEQLTGRSREQLRGTYVAELNKLLCARDENDQPVPLPSMSVNRALNGEVVQNLRRSFRHPDNGRTVEALLSVTPLPEGSGKICGALLIVRDITEMVRLQRQLSDAERHMKVGQMAAGLAHDFNNVLQAIIQTLELLDKSDDLPAQDRHIYAGMIRQAVTRGAEIIVRIRDYLRPGSGLKTNLDICKLLQEVLELTRPLWSEQGSISVCAELNSKMPPVFGDAADLRCVFTNLVINALEAMPGGGRLTVHCETSDNCVRADISDTGQGIPPELQKQIFEPFFTTKPKGTGLGLSGARRIVTSMHGNLCFRSEAGKGTTFTVTLPIAHANSHTREPHTSVQFRQ